MTFEKWSKGIVPLVSNDGIRGAELQMCLGDGEAFLTYRDGGWHECSFDGAGCMSKALICDSDDNAATIGVLKEVADKKRPIDDAVQEMVVAMFESFRGDINKVWHEDFEQHGLMRKE